MTISQLPQTSAGIAAAALYPAANTRLTGAARTRHGRVTATWALIGNNMAGRQALGSSLCASRVVAWRTIGNALSNISAAA